MFHILILIQSGFESPWLYALRHCTILGCREFIEKVESTGKSLRRHQILASAFVDRIHRGSAKEIRVAAGTGSREAKICKRYETISFYIKMNLIKLFVFQIFSGKE